jgi:hypothetical protein
MATLLVYRDVRRRSVLPERRVTANRLAIGTAAAQKENGKPP